MKNAISDWRSINTANHSSLKVSKVSSVGLIYPQNFQPLRSFSVGKFDENKNRGEILVRNEVEASTLSLYTIVLSVTTFEV